MSLEEIFSEIFNIQSDNLEDDLQLTDIESWDSMTHILLITKIEEEFEIDLSQDEIVNMQSVGQIRDIINKKGKLQA